MTFDSAFAEEAPGFYDLHKAWGVLPTTIEEFATSILPLISSIPVHRMSFSAARNLDELLRETFYEEYSPVEVQLRKNLSSAFTLPEIAFDPQFNQLLGTHHLHSLAQPTEFSGKLAYSPSLADFVGQKLRCEMDQQCSPQVDAFRIEALRTLNDVRMRVTDACGTAVGVGQTDFGLVDGLDRPSFYCLE